ncbi:hypothetical protein BCR42DRAFT_443269 [Absidia repens]|uniref:PiggyBac transposable element-derived protein domain-containing protein n=1 Tax=Absidia repens TaxID=90262 RepID=A0A1X2HZR7_9FUNG|nr:hypothetical protein BCR42DRAFT_443269 [Absidia repens]
MGKMVQIQRPQVFEEYETRKSAVDIANNRRDNLNNFHDTMKSYRWEVRTLAFFLGIAESHAFSAYKVFHQHGASMKHNSFKSKLADSILAFVDDQESLQEQMSASRMKTRGMDYHRSVPLGKTEAGKDIRRICRDCKKVKTMLRCSCDPLSPLCHDCWQPHFQHAWAEQTNSY